MKVFVKGKGEVSLTSANFVAEGGQAAVYQKNGTAYKVYTDPKHAIPEAKFLELEPIADPSVIRPERLLLDSKHEPVGYTMRFLENTLALCQIFPRVFRERRALDHARVASLVGKLQEHIAAVHKAGAVIVDLNELNVLVSDAIDEVFLIDVDSYQTKGFRAEVIMPSVRDWSVSPKDFSPLSDWYSFAILAFQMYVGIHPYKGTHPATAALPPDQRLEARMRQSLSALGPGVALPKACYPLDSIPEHQRLWMRAVLSDGKRVPPPDPRGAAVVHVMATVGPEIRFGAQLAVVEAASFGESIVGYALSGGRELVLTENGPLYLDGRAILRGVSGDVSMVGFTPKLGEPVVLTLKKNELFLWSGSPMRRQKIGADVSEVAKSGGRFYVRAGERVLEVEFFEGSTLTASATHVVANVLESASRLFEGCVLQNMLGSAFVSLFPRSHAGYQVRIPELDRYRIVDAKFEGGVLMVVGAQAGRYDRLVFRFDESFAAYDLTTVPNITPTGLNFLVTPAGICVHVTEDEKLEVFSARKGAAAQPRIVEDPAIGGDMRLLPVSGRVGFSRGKTLYLMTLK